MILAILISSLVFFLDISLFQQIPLLNQVNFLLLVLVALAYQPSRVKPVYLGLYLGFLYDLCFLDSFGFYMLSFFATGFFIQSLISYFNSNSFVSAILTGIFSFLFYQLFTGIFHQLLGTGLATEMVLRQSVNLRLLVQGGLQGLIFIFLNRYKGGKYDSLLD